MRKENIFWFKDLSANDVPLAGGKNASLGEMHRHLAGQGVNLPDGFVLTANAYWYYLSENKIDAKLRRLFQKFDASSLASLKNTGAAARRLIMAGYMPKDLEKEIIKNYQELSDKYKMKNADVAVRSSATAEDLPSASFAGQHETYLNVVGADALIEAVKKCMASLFTDRAIAYREEKGFAHMKIALSVGIQKMVRSDLASAGVIFTLDTETGFDKVVLVNSIWGVGEMIVKGKITPDEFFIFKPTLKKGFKPIIVKNLGRKNKKYVYSKDGLKEEVVTPNQQLKFSLTDEEVLKLAAWACLIEEHYQKAQDIEWAKDGKTGELFIVQSRPETVFTPNTIKTYEEFQIKTQKKPLLFGIAIGNKISVGKVRVISSMKQAAAFRRGEVLVTAMTDPDWVPIMRLASAIVTNEGGKTAHAAIVSRELGLPAIVGTGNATQVLKTGQTITVDCTQGLRGRIYEGKIPFRIKKYDFSDFAKPSSKLMVNLGVPEIAFKTSFLPVEGVGLAREEFIIAEKIRVHPLALYHFKKLKDKKLKEKIAAITVEHKDKNEFFIKELAEGISQIAAAFWPNEVIVRFSDFKTNEYKNLLGGELYEQEEANPMLGFRGASRYLDAGFQPAFNMECQAMKRAREVFGLENISVMVPFCRTVEEGKSVVELIRKFGLTDNNLKIYVMCEVPSNVILAEQFLEVFDGMSIGSNDLTQLVLGLDRDNAKIAPVGDERNEAVKRMIAEVIKACRLKNKYIGICGQAPSDFPDFAKFLEEQGISSISLNPDTVIKTLLHLTKNPK